MMSFCRPSKLREMPAPLKHTSRITLYRDSRRIDIHNEIQENFSSPHTWSFAFKVDAPDIWHEEVGAVIRAKLLGDGGHYSARNARYDWLALNHYADVSNQGLGVTLSNADCSFMRLGKSTLKELDARLVNGKLPVALAPQQIKTFRLMLTKQ